MCVGLTKSSETHKRFAARKVVKNFLPQWNDYYYFGSFLRPHHNHWALCIGASPESQKYYLVQSAVSSFRCAAVHNGPEV